MDAGLLEAVKDVDKFHSVFVNTFTDMTNMKSSGKERWRARREWMAFMAENVEEFGQRWPDLVSDLMTQMMDILGRGKGGETYLANARTVLWTVRAYLPASSSEEVEEGVAIEEIV